MPGKSLESNGSILVTATNGFSTPPFMLGEPRILSAVLETGDTTQKIEDIKNITEKFFFRFLGTDPETNSSFEPFFFKKILTPEASSWLTRKVSF